MKTFKYIIFFMKESPKFMNKSLLQLILHEHFFKAMTYYVKLMKKWDKSLEHATAVNTYCTLNMNLEV